METFKLALVCLAASLVAVSCTETTELDGYDYKTGELRFTTSSDDAKTRGLPVLSSDAMLDMGVFAYYTGDGTANNWVAQGATAAPNFMDDIQITNSGGIWSYDTPVYWPQAADANVSFFAYSPYATAANGITLNVSTGIPYIDYTVPTNCSDQPDLMVSALLQDRNKTNNGSSPVNFQMRHVLTCIGFKASGNGERVEKITVKGVKKSGRLSVSVDGTPSWDLSGAVNENFDAIVDDGIYLGATAELVNTGGGYLMMVPQTLETGATLTVELDSGRSFDFDLEGLSWGAGQFINYTLSITPEAALLLTPEKIVLPPMGGFSEFNVIVENGSSLDWTIAIDNTDFLICDNIEGLKAWATGTTSSSVLNVNGSTPSTTFTGTGTKTLYVWKSTPNPSVDTEITGIISNINDPGGASIKVIQLPDYAMSIVRNNYMEGEYVGAFWKASQKGERIIRIPVGNIAIRSGDWDASVFWLGPGWKAGDIVFSNDESADTGITYNSTTESPVNMLTNDAGYTVPGYASSASGTAINGAGYYIHFRIGLTSTYTPTVSNPVRYALVLLRYGTPQKYHIIYIRQGEEADYLMYPDDNSRGSAAVRFCVYNTTASDLTDADELVAISLPSRSNAVFTDYPTQAGAFFQWADIPSYGPLAYHPVKPITPTIWYNVPTANYWNTIQEDAESCPVGYRRPNDGTTSTYTLNANETLIKNSEIRQSLYSTPTTGDNASGANLRWGFYADGYFDRRDHNNPFVSSPGLGGKGMIANTAVSWESKDVAYIGSLLFNPVAGSPRENASLFIPGAGDRYSDGGSLIEGGEATLILSSSAPSLSDMWYYVSSSFSAMQLSSSRNHALSLRCVKENE